MKHAEQNVSSKQTVDSVPEDISRYTISWAGVGIMLACGIACAAWGYTRAEQGEMVRSFGSTDWGLLSIMMLLFGLGLWAGVSTLPSTDRTLCLNATLISIIVPFGQVGGVSIAFGMLPWDATTKAVRPMQLFLASTPILMPLNIALWLAPQQTLELLFGRGSVMDVLNAIFG